MLFLSSDRRSFVAWMALVGVAGARATGEAPKASNSLDLRIYKTTSKVVHNSVGLGARSEFTPMYVDGYTKIWLKWDQPKQTVRS